MIMLVWMKWIKKKKAVICAGLVVKKSGRSALIFSHFTPAWPCPADSSQILASVSSTSIRSLSWHHSTASIVLCHHLNNQGPIFRGGEEGSRKHMGPLTFCSLGAEGCRPAHWWDCTYTVYFVPMYGDQTSRHQKWLTPQRS